MNKSFLDNWNKWKDYPNNPLINPKPPDWIIADPTFISNKESPDELFHLFAHSIIAGINHYVSRDGFMWRNTFQKLFSGMRPFLFKENQEFYLLYEKVSSILGSSHIEIRKSIDLFDWSPPKTILKPSLLWEGKFPATNSNPCIIKKGNIYRLYYSAGSVFLKDCLFNEPKYIGLAESKHILGPYKKIEKPIITPNKNHPYRNMGAGAIKVIHLKNKNSWLAFNNGIYFDGKRTRSSILLLYSDDGIQFTEVFNKPIICPTRGWKKAFVYQLDVKKINNNGEYRLYYNARDGWFIGVERIGLSILNLK
ncbi:MAG: glycosyl hydrolase family 43 [Candidatus Lokiarchaeota archaeon]|nr:glycosyl hydrolase family 43 [Candidatus Lokiarchaeota archaeon]